jgi:hypothetical protein
MFKRVLRLETTKLVTKRNIFILAVVFGFLAFSCWNGINDYKLILENQKPFQEVERDKVSMHLHYTFYGIRGVRLLFIPTPISVLFNDTAVFRGMTAHVDTAEKLDISNSFKGKDLFADRSGYMDFSGIMLIIGACLALAYGNEILQSREYLKLLADVSGSRKPAFFIIVARVLLINLVFWVLSGLVLLWLLVNGINAAGLGFIPYLLGLTLVLTTFVLIGANIGTMKSKSLQVIIILAVYFPLVFFIPGMIQQLVYMEAKSGIQSIYDFEYETFKYIMAFEKRYYDRFGVLKSGETASEDALAMIRSRWDNEYKKLREVESERIKRLKRRIDSYQTLSAIFPTTFYLSTNKELSSKGFQSFINFYQHAYDMKHDFVRFYTERKIYRPSKKRGVEPFIKDNEDLYYARSQLPGSFKFGLTISLVWVGVLALLLWYRFSRLFASRPGQPDTDLLLDLKKKKTKVVISTDQERISKIVAGVRFYNPRTIRVPGWASLPGDMKIERYFSFFNVPLPEKLQPVAGLYCDSDLAPDHRARVITEIIRTYDADVFVFNEFLAGLSDDFVSYFLDLLETLKQEHHIVYFTGSIEISGKVGDKMTRYHDDPSL